MEEKAELWVGTPTFLVAKSINGSNVIPIRLLDVIPDDFKAMRALELNSESMMSINMRVVEEWFHRRAHWCPSTKVNRLSYFGQTVHAL